MRFARRRAAATASSASAARSSAPCSRASPRRTRSRSRKACARRSPRSSRRCRTRSRSASGVASFPAHGAAARRAARAAPTMRSTPPSGVGRTARASRATRYAAGPRTGPARGRPRPPAPARTPTPSATASTSRSWRSRSRVRSALDDARLDDLRTAARLHDIGKIAVPDAILQQARTARRRRVPHHQDPLGGRRRAAARRGDSRAPRPSSASITSASTAPATRRTRGDEICLESRIVHAADAYVAMIARPPVSQGDERRTRRSPSSCATAGTQFDRRRRRRADRHRAARPSATLDAIRTEPPSQRAAGRSLPDVAPGRCGLSWRHG